MSSRKDAKKDLLICVFCLSACLWLYENRIKECLTQRRKERKERFTNSCFLPKRMFSVLMFHYINLKIKH